MQGPNTVRVAGGRRRCSSKRRLHTLALEEGR